MTRGHQRLYDKSYFPVTSRTRVRNGFFSCAGTLGRGSWPITSCSCLPCGRNPAGGLDDEPSSGISRDSNDPISCLQRESDAATGPTAIGHDNSGRRTGLPILSMLIIPWPSPRISRTGNSPGWTEPAFHCVAVKTIRSKNPLLLDTSPDAQQ